MIEYDLPDDNSIGLKGGKSNAQMTVGWHVDDFIIAPKSQDIIDDFISKMNDVYGDLQPLTVHRGGTHRYLGMDLDFSLSGKVTVRMQDYIEEMLMEAPDEFAGEAATPAASHLFDTDPYATKLGTEKATMCCRLRVNAHATVASQ